RIVSAAAIRLDHRKSVRPFKGIFCDDISEFESYMPSQPVRSLHRRSCSQEFARHSRELATRSKGKDMAYSRNPGDCAITAAARAAENQYPAKVSRHSRLRRLWLRPRALRPTVSTNAARVGRTSARNSSLPRLRTARVGHTAAAGERADEGIA